MEKDLFILALTIVLVLVVGLGLVLTRLGNVTRSMREEQERLQRGLGEEMRSIRMETSNSIKQAMDSQNQILHGESLESEKRMENIRTTVESRLNAIQGDNSQKLEQMRELVDKRLQVTLESRINESFKMVNDRLEQVYKGLGEMQNLAVGVGDLKKVLSNVKTRGILGEIQLGAILQEILSPDQYEANVATKKGSQNVVEFAVKLPGEGGTVYLPIDAKFPADAYSKLVDAYELGDPAEVQRARVELSNRIKGFGKDIATKYIDVPYTTEFAVMFLPFESLYSEVIMLGLFEELQSKYKVTIAGPTTMGALLNSLQMGFRTLAIQKRSHEVWATLGSVKTEFDKFADALVMTQKRLDQANSELDNLVGVRTRQIQKKLKNVEAGEELDWEE